MLVNGVVGEAVSSLKSQAQQMKKQTDEINNIPPSMEVLKSSV